jgi:hypothetical protein
VLEINSALTPVFWCPLPLCPQFQRQDEVWKLELEDVIYSDAAETFFLAHLKCTMAPWYIN